LNIRNEYVFYHEAVSRNVFVVICNHKLAYLKQNRVNTSITKDIVYHKVEGVRDTIFSYSFRPIYMCSMNGYMLYRTYTKTPFYLFKRCTRALVCIAEPVGIVNVSNVCTALHTIKHFGY